MFGDLMTKYIGRKFLVFIVGTVIFLFCEKFTDIHWLYVAAIYLASNVLARVQESSFEVAEDTTWITKIIARYFGRKFLVFLTGTALFFFKEKFSTDSWLILSGMYCGSNVLVDFMPSIGATLKAIGGKLDGTPQEKLLEQEK